MKKQDIFVLSLIVLCSLLISAASIGHVSEETGRRGAGTTGPLPPTWERVTLLGRKAPTNEKINVRLRWKASTSQDVASYNVYRSLFSNKGYRYIGSTKEMEFADDTVKPGTVYYYVVTAVDVGGTESGYSEEKKVDLAKEAAKLQSSVPVGDEDSGFPGFFDGRRKLSPLVMGNLSAPEAESTMPAPGEAGKGKRNDVSSPRGSYDTFGEPFDEVWVVQRAESSGGGTNWNDAPGTGELRTKVPGEEKTVPLPLRHTEVQASVTGYIARVFVRQQYQNPYDGKIEAVYVFPLPQNAAVSDFIMTVGRRKIRGIIREREEARRIYLDARRQGYVASLLTQERPNIFTQRVANIEPGKAIDIDLVYFHTLAYARGEYSFVFPMVVGPRYNPPGWNDGIGAAPRGSHGHSGQPVTVQYLKPGERSGHDIAVRVDIDAGVDIGGVYSNTHAVSVEKKGTSKALVSLKPADRVPNKDFVLRYRVAGKRVKSALMLEPGDEGGYFTLILTPPGSLTDLPRMPKEMVFVLDCSGSMSGWPIGKAKAAMARALRNLNPDDTFQIIRFSNNASALGPVPVAATPGNIRRALKYVRSLRGSGGTQMIEGIKAALDFPHDEDHFRIISFMTDGYIGNEPQILSEIGKRLGASRIFSFGVGSSVNRYLIERMAKVGRGAVAYISTGDSDVEAVDAFYERIGHPALVDIEIDWGKMDAYDVYPKTIPDLFVGRPVIITGRYRGRPGKEIKITGRAGGEERSAVVKVDLGDEDTRSEGISKIWARAKIADLMDRMIVSGAHDMADQVKETALGHGLVSAYTAFVAVDDSRITQGDSGTTVFVPVPVPEGVKYETTVND